MQWGNFLDPSKWGNEVKYWGGAAARAVKEGVVDPIVEFEQSAARVDDGYSVLSIKDPGMPIVQTAAAS